MSSKKVHSAKPNTTCKAKITSIYTMVAKSKPAIPATKLETKVIYGKHKIGTISEVKLNYVNVSWDRRKEELFSRRNLGCLKNHKKI